MSKKQRIFDSAFKLGVAPMVGEPNVSISDACQSSVSRRVAQSPNHAWISGSVAIQPLPATALLPSICRRAAFAMILMLGSALAAQFTIDGPVGSGVPAGVGAFGASVTTLPNGNLVVTDPGFDAPGPITDVGAVYLYRPNGVLISTLRGSSMGDQVGRDGVVGLSNGNYVVGSRLWDNGGAADAGAVTFGSGINGVSGVVSPANSLVGSAAFDVVGIGGVTALTNGNYVVSSPGWDNGATVNAGAVTIGSGGSGISGVVSPLNSLVGTTKEDQVGADGSGAASVTALNNGNYVVRSPFWDNGATANVGAVTFGAGSGGISGVVSVSNSLVGSTAGDQVGSSGVTALSNGNYVVRSQFWDNGGAVNAGAVTFGSGSSGITGAVLPANSLVGNRANDFIGNTGVSALSNGNYVVSSRFWGNDTAANAGAVTFGSGIGGISGVVSPANSLVGTTAQDQVGSTWFGANGVTALSNGNYVVSSARWDNGATVDSGAVTFGSGSSGISGVVSPANSLLGSAPSDLVDGRVTALTNGNFVVSHPYWDNGATLNVGAVTFGSGSSAISGVVEPVNSLVGSAANDRVGTGVTALSDGHYLVSSPYWDDGATLDVGAITFGSGSGGIIGVVAAVNSTLGTAAGDQLGFPGVTALSNGNYVLASSAWDNGATVDVGAVTFGEAGGGISSAVSSANSLVGTAMGDRVGEITPLSNGNYVVSSLSWDNGGAVDAGAITLGLANGSLTGPISSTHSVLGAAANQGFTQVFSYDAVRNQLAVGQPASNRVVLQRTGIATAISIVGDTPDPSNGSQPVIFTATLGASPNAPTDGQVRFTASSGEYCVDTTPTATAASTAEFSCSIVFTSNGTASVIAEYTGSIAHAYSGSAPESHATVLDLLFENGFDTRARPGAKR